MTIACQLFGRFIKDNPFNTTPFLSRTCQSQTPTLVCSSLTHTLTTASLPPHCLSVRSFSLPPPFPWHCRLPLSRRATKSRSATPASPPPALTTRPPCSDLRPTSKPSSSFSTILCDRRPTTATEAETGDYESTWHGRM